MIADFFERWMKYISSLGEIDLGNSLLDGVSLSTTSVPE